MSSPAPPDRPGPRSTPPRPLGALRSDRAPGSGHARRWGRIDAATAARRITPRDRWIIRMLHEHTVLTTTQITRLAFPALRPAQQRLHTLHRLGVLDRFQPFLIRGSAPIHHVLGPLGAQILAAEEGIDLPALGYRRHRALGVAHRLTLAHDVATNTLFCDLATHPEHRMTRWWSAARCARLFGHHVRPDGYTTLATTDPNSPGGHRWWEMFCEYDTGTENLTALASKLTGYHRLAAATGITVPVAFWITRARREPSARAALAAAHRALPDPRLVPVVTATPQHLPHPDSLARDPGPRGDDDATAAGRTWLPLHAPVAKGRYRQGRWRLTELAAAAPRLEGPRHRADLGLHTADDPVNPSGRVELPAPLPYPPLPLSPESSQRWQR